ncbi:hypothetical protein PO909_013068 [Leuciscus waleckii]
MLSSGVRRVSTPVPEHRKNRVCSHSPSHVMPCCDIEPQVEQTPSAPEGSCGSASGLGSPRSILACRPVSYALAPPTFGSTRHPQPIDTTGFPHPTGSPLVSHQSTTDLPLRSFPPPLWLQQAPPSLRPRLCHTGITSVTLAPPQKFVTATSPRPSAPAMSLHWSSPS